MRQALVAGNQQIGDDERCVEPLGYRVARAGDARRGSALPLRRDAPTNPYGSSHRANADRDETSVDAARRVGRLRFFNANGGGNRPFRYLPSWRRPFFGVGWLLLEDGPIILARYMPGLQ
jgi:hypothetical protein